tara:strand:- start:257 stop:1102 length:846 start_codon:yes stop_codon:yes gene_type:complete
MKWWPVLIIFILFLIGCGSSEPDNLIDYNFRQGYSGLDVSFIDNAPPDQIYPYSEFKIIVELENLAADDIINGKVAILGLEDRYFIVDPLNQDFADLLGRSLTNPNGDKDVVEFYGSSVDLFQNADEYVNNYLLKISYDSEMEFADSICIKPNLYSTYDGGCEVEDKSYSGQGGPLAITGMEEIISPNSGVEFRLNLENKGEGKVGQVTLRRARLGNEALECQFRGERADLRRTNFDQEQQTTIICRKSFINGQSSYMTTLSMNFDYEYELVQQEQLMMVK